MLRCAPPGGYGSDYTHEDEANVVPGGTSAFAGAPNITS